MKNKDNSKFLKVLLGSTVAFAAACSSTAWAEEERQVAYLSASSANTFLLAAVAEMERVAEENNINLVEFDAQFDPAKQTAQMQDVIASGNYDGIVLVSISGAGAIPDVEAAVQEGIEVVIFNQIIGTDFTTADPQVDGVAASILVPPVKAGERQGELTVLACQDIDPCEVVYLYGIKGIPFDDALRAGFDSVIADHSNIDVIAEGEGKYLGPDGGITATQDILQTNDEFDVMVGADQSIQGAAIVFDDEGMTGQVKLIGSGGSSPAFEGIRDGSWFGGLFYAPANEGRIAMEAMVQALTDGTHLGGLDPVSELPDDGLVTINNIDKFSPQWDG